MAEDRANSPAAAYQGVDDLTAFADAAELERYRELLRQRSSEQAEFLGARLGTAAAAAYEVACGNGRLLIALAQGGWVGQALGTDLAESRIAFAQDWAGRLDLGNVTFDVADAAAAPTVPGPYELGLCITGALGYFEPLQPGLGAEVLRQLGQALAPGGLVCVEVYPHPRERALLEVSAGHIRTWQELADDDPWRYYLSDLELDGHTLTHRKTFVHRTEGRIDEGRIERLHLYSPESLRSLMESVGFAEVSLHEGWSDEPYRGGGALVATARTPS